MGVKKDIWKVVGKCVGMFSTYLTSLTIGQVSMLSMSEMLKIVAIKYLYLFFSKIST